MSNQTITTRGRVRAVLRLAVVAGITLLLSGCVLTPRGADEERARLTSAGQVYQQPAENRALPELPEPATWREVLHRAFLANGDLESAYFDWQAAVNRINQAAGYPNSNLSLGYEYMFSGERMKAWNRTTLSAGVDPMQNLAFPTKVAQAGKVALDQAQAAGKRFEAAKFALQRRALTAFLDLALQDERIRIQNDNVTLLRVLSENAAARVRTGAPQQDLLKTQTELELAENELRNMQAERRSMLATLNGLLVRAADAPLELGPALPPPRPIAADDATLIEVGVVNNPGLAGLARDVAGRADALELARLAYIPDINPVAAVTGGVSQSIGAMISVPTTLPQIRAAVAEARSMLRSSQAALRQARSDRAAAFVATLVVLRNDERQAAVLRDRILPLADQVLTNSRQAYSTGSIGLIELIDSQRTLLEVRRLTAEVVVEREKRLAELEELAGADVETLGRATTEPATIKVNP